MSPCTSCADLHTPCPCPAFLRWDAATNPAPTLRECLTCVEAEWLLLAGERWDDVAARLCMLPDSLERHPAPPRPPRPARLEDPMNEVWAWLSQRED